VQGVAATVQLFVIIAHVTVVDGDVAVIEMLKQWHRQKEH